MAFVLQQVKREGGIFSSDWGTVGEYSIISHLESDPIAAGNKFGMARNQRVVRIRLVMRADHQAIENQIERRRQPICRIALEDITVETVEGLAREDRCCP